MNKIDLKKFVRTVLLEKIQQESRIQGNLIKKTISFSGIQRESVCHGTVDDANEYARNNNLKFTISEDSYFGGHYNDDMTSYEFHPNAEFYGELMELNMSAREQLARICGTNDQVLTEVDTQIAENLVDFICTDKAFFDDKSSLVFEQIEKSIKDQLYDKTKFTKLFEYLIKQACLNEEVSLELSESEFDYATNCLSKRYFESHRDFTESNENITKCGKKSFKTGSALENMQRIVSGHQMFL